MYAPHPNRYQVEQIRKMEEEGLSVEEMSRVLTVEEEGIKAHLTPVAEKTPENKVETKDAK